jgi:hypothetical protein
MPLLLPTLFFCQCYCCYCSAASAAVVLFLPVLMLLSAVLLLSLCQVTPLFPLVAGVVTLRVTGWSTTSVLMAMPATAHLALREYLLPPAYHRASYVSPLYIV